MSASAGVSGTGNGNGPAIGDGSAGGNVSSSASRGNSRVASLSSSAILSSAHKRSLVNPAFASLDPLVVDADDVLSSLPVRLVAPYLTLVKDEQYVTQEGVRTLVARHYPDMLGTAKDIDEMKVAADALSLSLQSLTNALDGPSLPALEVDSAQASPTLYSIGACAAVLTAVPTVGERLLHPRAKTLHLAWLNALAEALWAYVCAHDPEAKDRWPILVSAMADVHILHKRAKALILRRWGKEKLSFRTLAADLLGYAYLTPTPAEDLLALALSQRTASLKRVTAPDGDAEKGVCKLLDRWVSLWADSVVFFTWAFVAHERGKGSLYAALSFDGCTDSSPWSQLNCTTLLEDVRALSASPVGGWIEHLPSRILDTKPSQDLTPWDTDSLANTVAGWIGSVTARMWDGDSGALLGELKSVAAVGRVGSYTSSVAEKTMKAIEEKIDPTDAGKKVLRAAQQALRAIGHSLQNRLDSVLVGLYTAQLAEMGDGFVHRLAALATLPDQDAKLALLAPPADDEGGKKTLLDRLHGLTPGVDTVLEPLEVSAGKVASEMDAFFHPLSQTDGGDCPAHALQAQFASAVLALLDRISHALSATGPTDGAEPKMPPLPPRAAGMVSSAIAQSRALAQLATAAGLDPQESVHTRLEELAQRGRATWLGARASAIAQGYARALSSGTSVSCPPAASAQAEEGDVPTPSLALLTALLDLSSAVRQVAPITALDRGYWKEEALAAFLRTCQPSEPRSSTSATQRDLHFLNACFSSEEGRQQALAYLGRYRLLLAPILCLAEETPHLPLPMQVDAYPAPTDAFEHLAIPAVRFRRVPV